MNASNIAQIVVYLLVLIVLAVPLGRFMAAIFDGSSVVVRKLGGLERCIYRLTGVDPTVEMSWKHYAIALVGFNVVGVLFLYVILRVQAGLPLNPSGFSGMTPDAAFNTAISFITNTDWQDYGGETTLGYLAQMVGLTVQNFLSAATGLVVAIALCRGFARHTVRTIGNVWVDMTRATLYVLLPLSVVLTLLFIGQGVIQNLQPAHDVQTVEAQTYQVAVNDAQGNPEKDAKGNPIMKNVSTQTQTLGMGPVASQEAIKMLGTNGGGFFNVNSAHPYENPTPFANFLQMIAMLVIPAALCITFGKMVGQAWQGRAILIAMTIAFTVAVVGEVSAEQSGNPAYTALGVTQAQTGGAAAQAGGNMEGKETRFGIVQSSIFTVATTSASCGAVNTMHDSLTPLGGLIPMLMIQLGEIIYGGVGSGLYGMLMSVLMTVFVAGLMIGRTPEYVGKKIGAYEMKMVSVAILVTPLLVLVGTSVAVLTAAGKAGIDNPGAHGFSEILYAFSSAANNNGSAFAGLTVSTPFYNVWLAIVMWGGRFSSLIAVLAAAGALAAKKRAAPTAGTLPTHGPLFISLLLGTLLLVGALTYLPALALGPIAEHLQMIGFH